MKNKTALFFIFGSAFITLICLFFCFAPVKADSFLPTSVNNPLLAKPQALTTPDLSPRCFAPFRDHFQHSIYPRTAGDMTRFGQYLAGEITDIISGALLPEVFTVVGPSLTVGDTAGNYMVWLPDGGTYPVFLSKPGYQLFGDEITLPDQCDSVMDFQLTPANGGYAGQGTIRGTVTNRYTDQAVSNATVWIVGQNHIQPNANGEFTCVRQSGPAAVVVIAPNYNLFVHHLEVMENRDTILPIRLNPYLAVPPPPSGGLEGIVKDDVTGLTLANVEVILGSQRQYTDPNGYYYFSEIPAGTEIISAYRRDYLLYTDQVDIVNYKRSKKDITLLPRPVSIPNFKGQLEGTVVDKVTGMPIYGAIIRGMRSTPLYSDRHGRFGAALDAAVYYYRIEAPHYKPEEGVLRLAANQTTALSISLNPWMQQPFLSSVPVTPSPMPGQGTPTEDNVLSVTAGGSISAALAIAATRASATNQVTVIVGPGEYRERLVVPSFVDVRSMDMFNTIINGVSVPGGSLVAFQNANYASLSGFTLTGGNADHGGALSITNSQYVTISHCILRYNQARFNGGGVYLSNCLDPVISNCLMVRNNSAHGNGGAIYMEDCYGIFPDSNDATINNCTIALNSALDGGGIFLKSGDDIRCTNNIIAENTGSGVSGSGFLSAHLFSYNDFWQNTPHQVSFYGSIAGVLGNIEADPQFVSGRLGDFYLSPNSPCLNAGHPDITGHTGMPVYGETTYGYRPGAADGSSGDRIDLGFHHHRISLSGYHVELLPMGSTARISINIASVPYHIMQNVGLRTVDGVTPHLAEFQHYFCDNQGIEIVQMAFDVPAWFPQYFNPFDYLKLEMVDSINPISMPSFPPNFYSGPSGLRNTESLCE